MCNAIRDGGRRCPIHQHTNQAGMNVVQLVTGLKMRQVQNLFRELRREGRNAEPMTTGDQYAVISSLQNLTPASSPDAFNNQYRRAVHTEEEIDASSFYALKRLHERAVNQANNLKGELLVISDRTGYTVEELQEKYDEEYNNVDTSRGAEAPAEFTPTNRARHVRAGLPYDQASVVALERIKQLETAAESVRRITEWQPFNSTLISQAGYSEGRLEISFHSNPSAIYAYHNVPQAMWDRMVTSPRPGSIYTRSIRGNSEFSYSSSEEADADAHALRCRLCGQFRTRDGHNCPGRQAAAPIAGTPVSTSTTFRVAEPRNDVAAMETFIASEYMQDRLPNSTVVTVQNGSETRNVVSIGTDRDEQDFRSNPGSMASRQPSTFTQQFADRSHPTIEEIHQVIETQAVFRGLSTVTTRHYMNVVRDHLHEYDFQFPVTADYAGNVTVEGNITVARLDDGEDLEDAVAYSHQLRCNCPQYQENYDCEHVRATARNPYMFLTNRSRLFGNRETLNTYANRNSSLIRQEESVSRLMSSERITREQARERIAEQEREAEAERAAQQERRRVQQEERERVRLEQGRREVERLNARNTTTIRENELYRRRMQERWETQDPGYSENIDQLFDYYKDVKRRKRAGEEVLTYRTENVTDGICADEPGARKFGVELEFTIEGGNRSNALRAIARDLHAAGLTDVDYQQRYHAARSSGWGSWSFEEDGTVDGELVSPILSDTPEHWEQLRKACEIIQRHGGVASTRAGSHVHISTASYEMSTAKHVELLRQVNKNDEIMYRLATNPSRGTHRGTQWCAPNVNDNLSDISADVVSAHSVLGAHTSHGYALNFETTYQQSYSRSNVEFRMWDATLDPGAIQRQVMLSAAMTDYAERNVIANGQSTPLPADTRRGIGNQRELERSVMTGRTHNRETFEQSMGNLPQFVDSLFRRTEDRKSIVDLFAVTSWQRH